MNELTYDDVQNIILSIIQKHIKDKKFHEMNCDELRALYEELRNRFANIQWDLDSKNYQRAQAELVVNELNRILDRMKELKCKTLE
jgi:(p)ppGpp synthase/HD superfamily hydrolase